METDKLINEARNEAHACYSSEEVLNWIDWFERKLSGNKKYKDLRKFYIQDVKLLLWDIADYLTKNKNIDLKTFNLFACKNNIKPKRTGDR